MNNSIDEIRRQYIYTVQPVKLFEAEKSPAAQNNSFEFISRMNSKDANYNPSHPNVSSETTARNLDLLG